jgi:hypothetical protein
MTYYLLYKTTCQITGKFYCGMHKTEELEDGYLGSGKRLRASVAKYGKENFTRELISTHDSQETLSKAEEELITPEMLSNPMCLNLVPGGKGGSGPGKLGASLGGQAYAKALEENSAFREVKIPQLCAAGKLGGALGSNLQIGERGKISAQTPEARSKRISTMRERGHQKGAKNSQSGTTCIYHPEHGNKRIPQQEIDSWITQGWLPGANIGTCFIHHPEALKGKLIPKGDLDSWTDQGWIPGMKPR